MDIKLSVTVITYNQEMFIEETLDSIVNQDLNVPFEIVIGDDASTDRTPEIIKMYADKYPDLIKPIFRTKNLGHTGNYIETTKAARSLSVSQSRKSVKFAFSASKISV